MKALALFVICLVAVNASSIKSQRLKAMSKLTYTSLFAEIEAQLSSGGPLSAITGTLDKLTKQIRDEQTEHDTMWAIQQADCVDEKEFRNAEIAAAADSLKRANTHFTACSHSLDKATIDLGTNEQDILDTQSALVEVQAIRVAEFALFEAMKADYLHAIETIEGTLDFLDELVGGDATLLQLSMMSMELIKSTSKISHIHVAAPAISLLATMAASEDDLFVDQTAVQRIRDMLTQMADTIADALDELQYNEANSKEAFEILSANLNQTILDLKSLNERLNDHISAMKQCVLAEGVIINQSTTKFDRNTKLLDAAVTMCDSFEHEYTTSTEGRNEELDLLKIIKVMAEKRISGMGSAGIEFGGDVSDASEDHSYTDANYGGEGGAQSDNLGLTD